MSLEVCVADLTASAVAVTGIGEELAVACSGAEVRLESACGGWQGLSAAALSVTAQRWRSDAASLLSRLASHAQDLHGCAASWWESEQHRARGFGAP